MSQRRALIFLSCLWIKIWSGSVAIGRKYNNSCQQHKQYLTSTRIFFMEHTDSKTHFSGVSANPAPRRKAPRSRITNRRPVNEWSNVLLALTCAMGWTASEKSLGGPHACLAQSFLCSRRWKRHGWGRLRMPTLFFQKVVFEKPEVS